MKKEMHIKNTTSTKIIYFNFSNDIQTLVNKIFQKIFSFKTGL